MCGIAGWFGPPDGLLLRRMRDTLVHRGPDDAGLWEEDWASLGFRRLSIIDLEGGHQPMESEDGSLVLVYNGEIYNYRELREELRALGYRFRTQSDTEVLLYAYHAWGPQAFPRLNGMWAAAFADRRRRQIILTRDHFGIKPLYYAAGPRRLAFASEIKALLVDPDFATAPDDQVVYEYLAYGLHDHRPETFFRGVRRVPAAGYVVVDGTGTREERYWEPRLGRDPSVDARAFTQAFRQSVARRLVADVPVGACLSGGLDSSTIVSLLADLLRQRLPDAQSLRGRVKTFSAVFDGDPIDERAYIEEEVRHTGADSDYVRPSSVEFVEELGQLVWHQDEPFVSTGPYAQWCVMRQAARQVKVVLDGQGGDELVAGYVPYQLVYLRQLLRERRYGRMAREAWAARDVLGPWLRRRLRERRRPFPGQRLLRRSFAASCKAPVDLRPQDRLKERLLLDVTTYSLPALLRYEDRNSMAHSIESRVPWLDQDLVEMVLRLPETSIIRDGWSRVLLREGMKGLLPERIRRRRWKVGFTTPETRWLFARRAVFQGLFASPAFHARRYWDGPEVARAFRDAAQGRTEASLLLWRLINVEVWLRIFFPDASPSAERPQDWIEAGDAWAARRLGPQAMEAMQRFRPNWGRHLFACAGGRVYLRAPVRTPVVREGDDLAAMLRAHLEPNLLPGDVVAVTEKVVAISQGRSFPVSQVRARPLARWLSRFVRRTPSGIGLGIPETMELAIREAGVSRILWAAAVAAAARLVGRRGVFYQLVPESVAAIDGPTQGTLPPYNTHAKLGPADPSGAARRLSQVLGVGVAIVDANDLDVRVLGASPGVDEELVRALFLDNPLGQGHEQTPVAILRAMGPCPHPQEEGASPKTSPMA